MKKKQSAQMALNTFFFFKVAYLKRKQNEMKFVRSQHLFLDASWFDIFI